MMETEGQGLKETEKQIESRYLQKKVWRISWFMTQLRQLSSSFVFFTRVPLFLPGRVPTRNWFSEPKLAENRTRL
jgi:hypothetical protein